MESISQLYKAGVIFIFILLLAMSPLWLFLLKQFDFKSLIWTWLKPKFKRSNCRIKQTTEVTGLGKKTVKYNIEVKLLFWWIKAYVPYKKYHSIEIRYKQVDFDKLIDANMVIATLTNAFPDGEPINNGLRIIFKEGAFVPIKYHLIATKYSYASYDDAMDKLTELKLSKKLTTTTRIMTLQSPQSKM